MLRSANISSPIPNRNDGCQVLNISNVNAQNEIVLNDEQLLELIQQYPFLYNHHVRPFNDADYDAWAWEQITKQFNRTYENLDRNVWFATIELIERWKVLQPIVRSLSKINNMTSLPETLRQTVVKMSVPMEEKSNNQIVTKPFTNAQKTLLGYESFINSLPIAERRRLEAEIMELILFSELDSKATIKLGSNELKTIENEYNDFMKIVGLDYFYCTEENSNGSEPLSNNLQNNSNTFVAPSESYMQTTVLSSSNNDENKAEYDGYGVANTPIISEKTDEALEIEPEIILNEINEDPLESKPNALNIVTESDKTSNMEAEESLLKPLITKWVPLNNWRHYERKCRVRIKRAVIKDKLPLVTVKREKL